MIRGGGASSPCHRCHCLGVEGPFYPQFDCGREKEGKIEGSHSFQHSYDVAPPTISRCWGNLACLKRVVPRLGPVERLSGRVCSTSPPMEFSIEAFVLHSHAFHTVLGPQFVPEGYATTSSWTPDYRSCRTWCVGSIQGINSTDRPLSAGRAEKKKRQTGKSIE